MTAAGAAHWWWVDDGRVMVRLKVTPKAKRAGLGPVIDLPDGAARKAAVTAAPEDGKANRALIALLAKRWGVAKSTVELVSGAGDRLKVLRLDDVDGTLARCLADGDAESR